MAAVTYKGGGIGWGGSTSGYMATHVAVTGKKPGKTTITASIGNRSFKCKVKVKASKGKLSTTSKTIKTGDSFVLTLKNYQGAGSIAWKTSDKTVAALNDHNYNCYSSYDKRGCKVYKEYATEFEIKGKSPGTATITVTFGSKKYKCKVIVTE